MKSLVFGSIIGVLVAFVGVRIRKIYKDRLVYLDDYCTFLGELLEEISFYRAPMNIFIDRVIDSKHVSFKRTLISYRESIYNGGDIIVDPYLKSNDKNIIQNCFSRIGRNDVTTEQNNIKNEIREADKLVEIARRELKSRGELVSKLMILLGIAVMILLV